MSNNRKGGLGKLSTEELKMLAVTSRFKKPLEKSIRHNEGKTKWSLMDFKSMEGLVDVLQFGVEKYGLDNWKVGLDPKETLESLMRHSISLLNGEELDEESKLHHAHHIMCNAMFYIYHQNKVKNESK